ncbi:MAG: hypothetical protein NVS3B21_03120 [Acidimicrobiales bacterium]
MRTKRTRRLVAGLTGVCLAMVNSCGGIRRSPSPTVRNSRLGIAANSAQLLYEPDDSFRRDMAAIERSGAGWIRVDADWSSIEAVRGSRRWGALDRTVFEARRAGLKVLLTIAYTPPWARPEATTDKYPPPKIALYGEFCSVVVGRYAPMGIHDYELWNEPNIPQFWSTGADPAAYAALLGAGSTAVHAADRLGRVITAGLAPAADDRSSGSMSPVTFLSELLSRDPTGFDAVGVHPYTFPKPPMTPGAAFVGTRDLAAILAKDGRGGTELWGTEFGAPTAANSESVDPAEQARNLHEAVTNWPSQAPHVGPLFWYTLRDTGSAPDVTEQHFGLLRNDLSPKPAYDAFVAEARKP